MICSKCIYDDTIPNITFDTNGVCNFCHTIDILKDEYGIGTKKGKDSWDKLLDTIKKKGKHKKYDCVVGLSGGVDSSYMLVKSIEWGLRPLAVHYDNTWNTSIATQNIRKLLEKLDVDLFTYVVDNKEMDNIFLSFFKASVPDLDCPTDIALAEILYRAASKYGVNYILEGHSFLTEGISPSSAIYMDGKYIKSVYNIFTSNKLKTFPNMSLLSFLKWAMVKRIKRVRPFWYISYSKQEARKYLEDNFGWVYYGGHHLENRITAFHNSYYCPTKFGIDNRNNSLSASVRAGLVSREKALLEYNSPPYIEDELVEYFKKRLNLSDFAFNSIMDYDKKTYRDYPTYKKTFEKLRILFFILMKLELVPKSFYMKYCANQG